MSSPPRPPEPGDGPDDSGAAYTYPPPTYPPDPDAAGPYALGPADPMAYRPPIDRPDPCESFLSNASRPTTYWPAFKNVVVLGWFVIAAVGLVILSDVIEIVGQVREYRVVGDLQNDFESVSFDRVAAVDDFVRRAGWIALGALFVTGILFVAWFYRVRWNAEAYGTHDQRRSQGWAIGSWICPFIALFYPYQMTTDVVVASEAEPGPPTRYAVSVLLVKVWWSVWLIGEGVALFARVDQDSSTFSGLRSHNVLEIVSSGINIVAAILVMLVIRRIVRAQSRWPAKVRALAAATG